MLFYPFFLAVTAGTGSKRASSFPAVPGCNFFLGERVIRSVYVCRQVAAVPHYLATVN